MEPLMRIRRHLPPIEEWSLSDATRRRLKRWGLTALGALVAGYLTAYLLIFPAPILPGHDEVPRVLGLSQAEAQALLSTASMAVHDGGSEPHPTATQGTVIWQDPPPGVIAPEKTEVTLVVSAGPPKIPVPDVAGLDGLLAERLITAAGLAVSQVDSLQAPLPKGVVMHTRPAAGSVLTPGGGVTLIVSRGAPTISVPNLLGLTQADARTRLELEGLRLGTVTRQRTADAAPGTVVAQRPAAGTLAASGTVVDIVVARSPQ
jgi:eukaryotic-like serine/threonine-protein kinase